MGVLHTREQGLRVHVLANLGGLVAICGLEEVEPALLTGLLLDLADRLPGMDPREVERLTGRGRARLDERNAEKRAWKAHQRLLDLHRVDLTTEQLHRLLRTLRVPIPSDREQLGLALSEALAAGDRKRGARRGRSR